MGVFEEIGEKLSKMVRIPTVSGAGNEPEYQIQEYRRVLKKEFPGLFAAVEETAIGEARLLYLAGTQRERRPVLFNGHMDVVPAAAEAWRYPPFSGTIAEGEVWGRGSQDMKGPQCALLSALEELVQEGWGPERDIWLYLSCDEETGGAVTEQAAEWLEQKGVRFEAVFDEGGTICQDFMGMVQGWAALFGIAEKGSLAYRFTARSSGGHAADPPGHSAIVRLADFMHEVEYGRIFKAGLSAGNRVMLQEIAEHADGRTREILRQALKEDADPALLGSVCGQAGTILGATIAFTRIEGGTAFNVMPKEAKLTANVRVGSIETEKEITKKLEELARKHDLLCELMSGADASPESSVEDAGYQAMKHAVEEIYPGLPVIPFVLGGGTDSRHFERLTDSVLRFSPMKAAKRQGSGVHGDNESADIEAVRMAAACYYTFLKKWLR